MGVRSRGSAATKNRLQVALRSYRIHVDETTIMNAGPYGVVGMILCGWTHSHSPEVVHMYIYVYTYISIYLLTTKFIVMYMGEVPGYC